MRRAVGENHEREGPWGTSHAGREIFPVHQMSADVVRFPGNTIVPDAPEVALEKAKSWGLERVVICGWTTGDKFIIGGSHSEIAEAVFLLEFGKKRLLEQADRD